MRARLTIFGIGRRRHERLMPVDLVIAATASASTSASLRCGLCLSLRSLLPFVSVAADVEWSAVAASALSVAADAGSSLLLLALGRLLLLPLRCLLLLSLGRLLLLALGRLLPLRCLLLLSLGRLLLTCAE